MPVHVGEASPRHIHTFGFAPQSRCPRAANAMPLRHNRTVVTPQTQNDEIHIDKPSPKRTSIAP